MAIRTRKQAAVAEAATGPAKLDMGRLEDAIGFLLGRAWRDAQRRFERHFREIRLTPQQFAILILLERNHECTPGELSVATGMGHNNLVVVIDDLVERGLVTRNPCVEDRRKKRLGLTDSGAALLALGNAAEDRSQAEFAAQFGPQYGARLLALLRRIEEP